MHCKCCKPFSRYLNVGTKRAPGRFAFIVSMDRQASWDFLWFSKVWPNARVFSFTQQVSSNIPMVSVNLGMYCFAYTNDFHINLLQTRICCFNVDLAIDIQLFGKVFIVSRTRTFFPKSFPLLFSDVNKGLILCVVNQGPRQGQKLTSLLYTRVER